MADVHKLPNMSRVEREASEWIARLDADDVTEEDRQRFEEWRAEHQAHARAYEELSATYQEYATAGPFIRAVSFAQSMSEAAATRRSPRRGALIGAAAALAACLIGAFIYMYRWPSTPTYQTAVGEHATISLPDGSTLELNSASTARVQYGRNERIVQLERGEGFFKVRHDAQRPFWVEAGRSWIRAVGTAFDVYIRPDAVEVTVSEGTVGVGAGPRSRPETRLSDSQTVQEPVALLKAGQQAHVQGLATATRQLSSVQLAQTVAWRDGVLYFENQPLNEVAAELGRYSALQFVIEDERVGHLLVGGTFQASPQGAETLMSMLEQGFGLKIERAGSQVRIQRAPHRAITSPMVLDNPRPEH